MQIKDITGVNDPLIAKMNRESPHSLTHRFLIDDKYILLRSYDLTEVTCPFYFSISSTDNTKVPNEIINSVLKNNLLHQELINQYNLSVQTSPNNITHIFPVSKKEMS